MRKSLVVAIVMLSLVVAFVAGVFVVRAQGPVMYGDVFACYIKGKGRLVEDTQDCKPDETVVGWFDVETMIALSAAIQSEIEALQADVAGFEQLDFYRVQGIGAYADCDVGDKVTGGGFSAGTEQHVIKSIPYADMSGWEVQAKKGWDLAAYAICADYPPYRPAD